MPISRFDIAIAGDSLAARMTAALLARHGKRLLLLSTSAHRDPWQFSSLFVEKLFSALGGRDSLTPAQPFQVLSSRARVTIHREIPLGHELTREFGSVAVLVETMLDELERTGTLLEDVLWEHGGLPANGLRERMAWQWLCLRRKLPLAALARPLAERLQGLPDPAAEWLRDLFQGLSLQPIAKLTVADGALLWAHARRPEGFTGDKLDELLHKRFLQFHGSETRLENLNALEYSHGHWVGSLPDGGHFHAGQLILGDLGKGLPGQSAQQLHPTSGSPRRFLTSALDGQLSALLEKRVIVGGSLPMRVAVVPAATGMAGEIGVGARSEESDIRCQLEPILPFARYALNARTHEQEAITPSDTAALPSIFKLALPLGSHLWCADEARLAPHLGCGGAAQIAWTLVRHLDPTAFVRS